MKKRKKEKGWTRLLILTCLAHQSKNCIGLVSYSSQALPFNPASTITWSSAGSPNPLAYVGLDGTVSSEFHVTSAGWLAKTTLSCHPSPFLSHWHWFPSSSTQTNCPGSGDMGTHGKEFFRQLTSVSRRAGTKQVCRELGAEACLNLKGTMVVLNVNRFAAHRLMGAEVGVHVF